MRHYRSQELRALGEQFDGEMGLVIAAAHVEEWRFFAAEFVEMDHRTGFAGDPGGDYAAAFGDGDTGMVKRSVASDAIENGFDTALIGGGEDFL